MLGRRDIAWPSQCRPRAQEGPRRSGTAGETAGGESESTRAIGSSGEGAGGKGGAAAIAHNSWLFAVMLFAGGVPGLERGGVNRVSRLGVLSSRARNSERSRSLRPALADSDVGHPPTTIIPVLPPPPIIHARKWFWAGEGSGKREGRLHLRWSVNGAPDTAVNDFDD